jgi:hypothetical protein
MVGERSKIKADSGVESLSRPAWQDTQRLPCLAIPTVVHRLGALETRESLHNSAEALASGAHGV